MLKKLFEVCRKLLALPSMPKKPRLWQLAKYLLSLPDPPPILIPGQLVRCKYEGPMLVRLHGVDKPYLSIFILDRETIGLYIKDCVITLGPNRMYKAYNESLDRKKHIVLIGDKYVEFEFGSLEVFDDKEAI